MEKVISWGKKKNHGHTLVSRLSLIFILCYARSWTEMKVEGEQGRGSVKEPFITATRALPPRLLAAVLGIRCCASLAVGMFTRWSLYHTSVNVSGMKVVWQSLFRRCKRIYVKERYFLLVFIYTATLWAFLAPLFGARKWWK